MTLLWTIMFQEHNFSNCCDPLEVGTATSSAQYFILIWKVDSGVSQCKDRYVEQAVSSFTPYMYIHCYEGTLKHIHGSGTGMLLFGHPSEKCLDNLK